MEVHIRDKNQPGKALKTKVLVCCSSTFGVRNPTTFDRRSRSKIDLGQLYLPVTCHFCSKPSCKDVMDIVSKKLVTLLALCERISSLILPYQLIQTNRFCRTDSIHSSIWLEVMVPHQKFTLFATTLSQPLHENLCNVTMKQVFDQSLSTEHN